MNQSEDSLSLDIAYVNGSVSAQCNAAFQEVQRICNSIPGVKLHCINLHRLNEDDSETTSLFYNADLAIVDASLQSHQHSLSYRLGIRESYGWNQCMCIILFNRDTGTESLSAKSFSRYTTIVYHVSGNMQCIVDQMVYKGNPDMLETEQCAVGDKIQCLLKDLKVQIKSHKKEKFLNDLRKAKEGNSGEKLRKILHNMRLKLCDTCLLSAETVYNILLSFREIQDYNAMIELVEDLNRIPGWKNLCTPLIDHLYAFALNRRNQNEDRQLAEELVTSALQKVEYQFLEMFCLCGRIYKDKFIDSEYTDMGSLDSAIHWYRKGFEMEENEYAGINLATLLMIKGSTFSSCPELQNIFILLNNVIGRKGELHTQKNYWDVATFFEISILSEEYSRAIQAAASMFKLKPPNWCLQSTISNIQLINKLLRKKGTEKTPEEIIFHFWMDYFVEASSEKEPSTDRLPILIMDSANSCMPSYVTLKNEPEEKSLSISNLCIETLKGTCTSPHEFHYNQDSIKSISFYKEEENCLFFYIHHNSVDVQAVFPSVDHSKIFHQQVLQMKR